MPRHLISDAHEWINEIPTVPSPDSPIPKFSFSLLFFSLPEAILVSPPCCCGYSPPERLPELLSVSPWEMGPDPAPPSVILAIPVPPPPSNPSSPSSNQDPPTLVSDLPSSPPDPACPLPVLASLLSGSALASSASPAIQDQLSRRDPPADLLCFQHLLSPSSSFEPPSAPQLPAAPEPPPATPEPPPAAPTVSVAPSSPTILPLSNSLHHPPAESHSAGQPAVLHLGTQPARHNASASAAPPPILQPPPAGIPHAPAFPPLPSGAPTAPLLARPAAGSLPALPADLRQRPPSVRRNSQATSLAAAQDPPLRSYAQVASGTRGSGFVSSHARDIEAFARLPRTGINIISGSREGLHSFGFAPSDFPKIAAAYANALVMKFLGGRPSLEQSHKEISSWGIENQFSIGPLSSRAFLLRFQNENDLLKVLTRPLQSLITFPYKIFRWNTQCDIKEDSCMAPVWVSLPNIKLHCFLPEFLEAVANRIGRFLCLDKATATLARPSSARMCIEIDLRKPPPQFIWVELFDGFKQPVVYEKLPKFCTQCHLRGHSTVHCSKFTLDTPQTQLAERPSAVQNGTPPVRRNAKVQSSVSSKENIPLGTQLGAVPPQPSSVAAPAAPLLPSDTSHQDPPDPSQQQRHPPPISPVVRSSEQQHIAAEPSVPSPLLQSPTHQAPPAAAPHLPAPQLQSSIDVATQQPLPPLPSNAKALLQSGVSEALLQSPSSGHVVPHLAAAGPAAAVPPIAQEPGPAAAQSLPAVQPLPHPPSPSQPELPAAAQQLPAVQPILQSSDAAATHQPVTSDLHPAAAHPLLQSTAAAESYPPHPPLPSKAEASSSSQLPAAAVSPYDSQAHPVGTPRSESAPAADFSPSQVLSAQAAPFSPSEPVQSSQNSTALINQHSTSSLGFFYNKHGAKCMNMPSREMVERQLGNQGHLSSLLKAPTPSKFPLQNHHFEGFESEGSFETDSQQNSPSGSPLKEVNQCIFPPQVSEGEDLTEDHPGFQGHNSDVDFYHRPRSSKKNKRQPDGPLRIQLRARKGLSSRK